PILRTSATTWATSGPRACCHRGSTWHTTASSWKWKRWPRHEDLSQPGGPAARLRTQRAYHRQLRRRALRPSENSAARDGTGARAWLEAVGAHVRSASHTRSGAGADAAAANQPGETRVADGGRGHRAGADSALHARAGAAIAGGVRAATTGGSAGRTRGAGGG